MPWTRKQIKYLLSKGSPLTSEQKQKMVGELHANPAMGHKKKGSKALKRAKPHGQTSVRHANQHHSSETHGYHW